MACWSFSQDFFLVVYQIVEEINRRFVIEIQNMHILDDYGKVERMAILYDGQVKNGSSCNRCEVFSKWCCPSSYRNS